MLLALNLDQRGSPRKLLTGLLPGPLKLDSTQEVLTCKPTDISSEGLGLLIDRELPETTLLCLVYKEQKILLQIVWRKPDLARTHRFRYGLVCVDKNIDLEQIFIQGGCLKIL